MLVNSYTSLSVRGRRIGRFTVAIAAIVTAQALIIGCATGDRATPGTTAGGPPSAVVDATASPPVNPSAASAPASVEPPGTDDHAEPTAAAPAAAAPAAAAGFAAAWVRRELPAQQWLAGVTRWCEPGFAKLLATADPRNLPSSKVAGKPKAVRKPAGRSAEYTVATDSGTLTVVLGDYRGRWLVVGNDYSPRS
jgi:hypothetical protein